MFYCCLVSCRLRLLFLLILMNIQINKISFIYFLLQNFYYLFLTLHPQPPFFLGLHARGCCSTLSTPTSRGKASVKCSVYHSCFYLKKKKKTIFFMNMDYFISTPTYWSSPPLAPVEKKFWRRAWMMDGWMGRHYRQVDDGWMGI